MRKLLNEKFFVPQSNAISDVASVAGRYDDLINLSIGDPDIKTPQRVVELAFADALAGHTKYTDPQGYPELREEIRAFYREEYGIPVKDEEVFVSSSGLTAMYLAMAVTLDPGDEVIVPDPFFTCYQGQIEAAGGVVVPLPTCREEGFGISLERLEGLVTPRTKGILLNSPNNPTGACLSRKDLEQIAEVCQRHDLLVYADDIYTNFCYGETFFPMLGIPGMADRTITVNSFSKNFIMTGFRVGNLIAPKEIICAVKQMNEYVVYSAPSISQRAALWALRERREIEPPIFRQFKERVEYAAGRINGLGKMSVDEPRGSIYLFPDIRGTGLTSAQAASRILEEAHVLVLPGDTFGRYGEGYLRIACTVENEVMGEAFDRIGKMPLFGLQAGPT